MTLTGSTSTIKLSLFSLVKNTVQLSIDGLELEIQF